MKRSHEKEMMDLPGHRPELLTEDLSNLRRLNRYLNGRRCVLLALRRALGRETPERATLLDVGTGSADIPAAIVSWAKRARIAIRVVGLEAEPLTACIAAARTHEFSELSIIRGSAEALPFGQKTFDVVMASQFLHHFSEDNIIELLKRWASCARQAIVISDLVRHPAAYHGIRLLTALTTRNAMTLKDAPLSVRRAFTLREWRDLFTQAQIGPLEMFSVFPFRMAAVLRTRAN